MVAANDATEVSRIAVAVGPLSGVDASLLARAFEVARMGTIAAHAQLEIETISGGGVVQGMCVIETPVLQTLCCAAAVVPGRSN